MIETDFFYKHAKLVQTILSAVWPLITRATVLAIVFCYGSAFAQKPNLDFIRGTVSDESGAPLPNVRIDISTAAPVSGPAIFCPSCYLDCQKWTTTDQSGNFEISDLDSGLAYRLVVAAPRYKTMQTELLAPGNTSSNLTLLERTGSVDPDRVISGFVKNEYGHPIQGAIVTPVSVIHKDGLRSFSSKGVALAVTDANGSFEIDLVEGVFGVDVEIAADGFCNRKFVGLNPIADEQVFEVFVGAQVSGRVKNRDRPVQGMTISVAQTDRSSRGEKFFQQATPTVTNDEGEFEFKNLLPDQEYCIYTVVGEADRSDSDAIIKTQTFVTPPSGMSLKVGSLTTVEPATLAGRVVVSDPRALVDLQISLRRDPAWDLIEVPVGRDGLFRIEGLPPEVYEIKLASSRFVLDADQIDSLLRTSKSVTRLIEKSILDFVLPISSLEQANRDTEQIGMRVLNGRVALVDGEGASGIIVSANNGNRPKTSTAQDGGFTLEFPIKTDWIKLYRPDPDGMRFWYLGMFKPGRGDADISIQLGPETTYEPGTLSAIRE